MKKVNDFLQSHLRYASKLAIGGRGFYFLEFSFGHLIAIIFSYLVGKRVGRELFGRELFHGAFSLDVKFMGSASQHAHAVLSRFHAACACVHFVHMAMNLLFNLLNSLKKFNRFSIG